MQNLSRAQSEVSSKLVFKLMVFFLCTVFAMYVSEYAVYAVGGLVLYTITQKRVELTFFTLVLLVSLSIINPVLCKKGFSFYLVLRGSLFLLAIAMTLRSGFMRSAWFLSPFIWLYSYMGVIMVTSLVGWCPIISEMKAILFIVFLLALVQGVSAVVQSGVDIMTIRAVLLMVAIFYIIGSLLTIPFPAIGRSMILAKTSGWGGALSNTEISGLFNGLTWHSQTLGPTVAMLNAFLLSDYLCNFKKKNGLYLILLMSVPILVYMTSSRTALFAYLISILASLFFFMGERRASASKKNKVLLTTSFFAFFAVIFIFVKPGGVESAEAFLRKARDVDEVRTRETLTESLMKTRQGKVDEGLQNFRESPWIGNGFQVAEEMQNFSMSEAGLILSAPIEKGVLPVMVLEEGGVVGATLFSLFVIFVYVKYKKLGFACFLSTFTVFLGLNSGEASFFSTSGGGGILWMICFCSLLMDVHRHRKRLAEMQPQWVLPSPASAGQ